MRHFQIFMAVVLLGSLGAREAGAQAAGAFARMGFGARGIAMSNALVADGSGHASPYYNPALAPFTADQHLEATAALLSLDRELQFLQFAAPLRPNAGIAVGLVHAGVSGIDGRDASGYHTQEYATDEFAFFLAFGTHLGRRLTAGVGLQVFRADLLEELPAINSIGLDVGLSFRVTESFRLGAAVDDVLARYAWDTSGLYGSSGRSTTDRFPLRLRVGAAYGALDGRASVVAEYESRVRAADLRVPGIRFFEDVPRQTIEEESLHLYEGRLRMGAEYRLVDAFALRAGLDRVGPGGFTSVQPSAGFMVEQPVGSLTARAAYAFVLENYGTGSMHVLTLRVFL